MRTDGVKSLFFFNQSLNEEVFSKEQSSLVMKEMDTLRQLIGILETINAPKEDTMELKKSIEQLKDLFLLVIVGEFNSGKSSFLNAMLGKKWLEEGVTPTTAQVNILRNGPEFKVVQRSGLVAGLSKQDEHVEVHVPVPWLKQISLVDTPGTNAVVQGHQEITEHFVPRSDLVLFVTSCDRAFTESERAFLERVKQFNKKVVVVLSKIDALENPEKDLPQIVSFVNEQTKRLFGFVPQTFPVSSKLALRAKIAAASKGVTDSAARANELEHNEEWLRSRFGPLESYILDTLNAKERGKLKLQNPLGIAEHFIQKYKVEQENRAAIIKEDVQTLGRIENELEAFKAELMSEYSYHEDRIDSVLYSLTERARNYLEENLVLSNAWKLTKADVMKEEFEKRVVADTPAQIDAYINDMIDWMLSKQAKQWSRVVEYASQRQQISNLLSGVDPAKGVIGTFKTQYSYNRSLLIGNLGGSAKKVVDEFDRRKEAEHLAATVKSAIYQTAAFEIGVVGIVCAYFKGLFPSPRTPTDLNRLPDSSSTIVDSSTVASNSAINDVATTSFADFMLQPIIQGGWLTLSLLDITGLVGVTTVAALGMAWLPYRKRQLLGDLTSQISDIRIRLKSSLKSHFDHELQKGISELKENMSPYANLVQSEQKKLDLAGEKLDDVSKTVSQLRREIDVAFH